MDPYWTKTNPLLRLEALSHDVETDVCIIGAGFAGLTTAYTLAREGRRAVVLDDGPVAGGESARTTAHLSNALDDRYFELERLHGGAYARDAADSHTNAIDYIESIVRTESIDCGFRRVDGHLFAHNSDAQNDLDREFEAAHRAGLNVTFIERAPGMRVNTGRCLRFPEQGQLHPTQYLEGLARAFMRKGGIIFTGSHADCIEGANPLRVRVRGGYTVSAGSVVVATNSPVCDRYGFYTLQGAYRTYVIGARASSHSLPDALLWDTADPYHYIRTSGDLLIIGGEDHHTGQCDDHHEPFRCLEDWSREHFAIGPVEYRWSGQIMEPVDGMAFIGRFPLSPERIYLATGDSGNGTTHGTIAGLILTDLIIGRENRWSSLYDPSRITANALSEYATENVKVLSQYYDWVTPGDVGSRDQVQPGCGAVLRDGSSKIAVYREPSGAFRQMSAVCPHLGGILTWNDAEKSWDCPIHGSRFDCNGRVINGPANRALDYSGGSAETALKIASTGLQTAASMTINGMQKILTLAIRTGY